MNGHNSFAPQGVPRGPQQRHSTDLTSHQPNHTRTATEGNPVAPMPTNSHQRGMSGTPGDMRGGMGPKAPARSPPRNKNTQFVPCKFFLQGQCQAGRMCPFSHDVESSTRPAPCKYFMKGGCKFGRKCALLHVGPDGTVLNRPFPPTASFPPAPQPQAGNFAQQPQHVPGLLSMQAQTLEQRPNGDAQHDFDIYRHGPRNGLDGSQLDMTRTPASPKWGSPSQDYQLAGSPPGNGLSVLDVPLPNSFDSNGISMAARNGPFAASVPSRFNAESPPSSLPRRAQLGNTALRDLHNSAFGERGMDNVLAGSSPPSGPDEPLRFPKRSLHVRSPYGTHGHMISASLGTRLPTQSFEYSDEDEEDIESDREEGLLPASLHDLIPDSRSRRESRSRMQEEEKSPASFLAAQRRTISYHGTPQDNKLASPHSSSPSRFSGSIWTRNQSGPRDGDGTSPGPVGSPLRNSGLYFGSLPSATTYRTNGDVSPSVASPPRQASMSMLTQELQRTKLDAAWSQRPPVASRTVSGGSNGGAGRSSLDRALSTHSVGREKIDEEQELFDMDEVGDLTKSGSRAMQDRGENRAEGGSNGSFGAIGGHRSGK